MAKVKAKMDHRRGQSRESGDVMTAEQRGRETDCAEGGILYYDRKLQLMCASVCHCRSANMSNLQERTQMLVSLRKELALQSEIVLLVALDHQNVNGSRVAGETVSNTQAAQD